MNFNPFLSYHSNVPTVHIWNVRISFLLFKRVLNVSRRIWQRCFEYFLLLIIYHIFEFFLTCFYSYIIHLCIKKLHPKPYLVKCLLWDHDIGLQNPRNCPETIHPQTYVVLFFRSFPYNNLTCTFYYLNNLSSFRKYNMPQPKIRINLWHLITCDIIKINKMHTVS